MSGEKIGLAEILASMGIGGLIGAVISRPPDYEKIKDDYKTLKKNYDNLKKFHNSWKHFANTFQKRLSKLRGFDIKIEKSMPEVTKGVLHNAIRCYLFGLFIPTCIMAARAAEIHLKVVRKRLEGYTNDVNFDGLIKWAKDKKFISELDNVSAEYLRKARNLMVHRPAGVIKEIDALHSLHAASKIILNMNVAEKDKCG